MAPQTCDVAGPSPTLDDVRVQYDLRRDVEEVNGDMGRECDVADLTQDHVLRVLAHGGLHLMDEVGDFLVLEAAAAGSDVAVVDAEALDVNGRTAEEPNIVLELQRPLGRAQRGPG